MSNSSEKPNSYYVIKDDRHGRGHVELGELTSCDHCGKRVSLNSHEYVIEDTDLLKNATEVTLPQGKIRRLGIPLDKSPDPVITDLDGELTLCQTCTELKGSQAPQLNTVNVDTAA